MRRTVQFGLTVMGTCLLIAAPAFSQDDDVAAPAFSQDDDYARSGGYVGVSVIGGSYTRIDDETEDYLLAIGYIVDIDTDEAVGFKLYGGYRLIPHVAIEAEFEMLPRADVNVSGLGDVIELQSWVLTGNAKAFLLTGRTQPYVLAGIGVMEADFEDTVGAGLSQTEADFAARFGGGVDFYITENVLASVGIDYVLPTGDVEYFDYISFGGGIQYRF